MDGDEDTDLENAISEEDKVTEDTAADNALVQNLVQDFARGAAAKVLSLTKAERDQRNVERVRYCFHIICGFYELRVRACVRACVSTHASIHPHQGYSVHGRRAHR